MSLLKYKVGKLVCVTGLLGVLGCGYYFGYYAKTEEHYLHEKHALKPIKGKNLIGEKGDKYIIQVELFDKSKYYQVDKSHVVIEKDKGDYMILSQKCIVNKRTQHSVGNENEYCVTLCTNQKPVHVNENDECCRVLNR